MPLTVCVLNNNDLAKELGKKGTESDITVYNRKSGNETYTFFVPHSYPEKVSSLLQCIGGSDFAILYASGITKELGETIIALDSFGMDKGLLVLENIAIDELRPLIANTVVGKYAVSEKDYSAVMAHLEKVQPEKKAGPVKVGIDHSFDVKSVGTVALGIVKRGTVAKHSKLEAFPVKMEVIVRSIQIHDEDYDSAEFGARVGLALKGADHDELTRGSFVAEKGSIRSGKSLELTFAKSKYYKESFIEKQKAFIGIGMQYLGCDIDEIDGDRVKLTAQKEVAYEPGDRIVIANQDIQGLRIIGGGRVA